LTSGLGLGLGLGLTDYNSSLQMTTG
jgi:hypothetical protein